jgi:hypothetical protein
VDHPISLREVNFDQATSAWPAGTRAGVGGVLGTVGSTQQPAATGIKKLVRLKVHLHRHMGAAVEVCMWLTLKANGKRAAGLASKHHIKRHSAATFG